MTPEKLDAYHERIGVKPSRHPFTPGGGSRGVATVGCLICPMSEGHKTHAGAEVFSMDQFRSKRR